MDEIEKHTTIVRVYREAGQDEDELWVDVEVLDLAQFRGKQYPGLDRGNQDLETILELDYDKRKKEDGDIVDVQIDPDDKKYSVQVPVLSTIEFTSRNGEYYYREFYNEVRDSGRKYKKWRIFSHNIDDSFLDKDRQPPKVLKDYKKAVSDSDDESTLPLDVCVIEYWEASRGGTTQYQEVRFSDLAEDTFPIIGAKESKEDATAVMLDPYQRIINFGPDSLAVEFEK